MRTFLRSLVPIALVLAFAGCNETKDKNEKRVVIFFTTDEHSNLYASSPELDDFLGATNEPQLLGGVERRMTILKRERDAAAAAGKATLTLSSGDFSQGSLSSAAWLATSPELATMKAMGYDAVALGNHEFDLGDTALAGMLGNAAATQTALPQLLLSNLDTTKATALAPLYGAGKPIAKFVVLPTSNGLKIGVVSSMGVGAGTVAGAAPAGAFWPTTAADTTAKFNAVLAQVQAAVDAVRAEGVDAVVLLAHGGIGATTAKPGEDELIAQQLKGVDLVLSGHSHLFTPQPRIQYGTKAVPLVQAKPFGHDVGKVELVFWDDDSAPRPFLDPNGTQFFEVTSDVAKSTDAALVGNLQQRTVGFLEFGLDGQDSTAVPSFLEATLSRITGTTIHADKTKPGSLWNRPLGRLDYTVVGMAPGETNAMNLDTDAMLAAVKGAALIGLPPGACAACPAATVAIQASGPIRGDLRPTGVDTTAIYGFTQPVTFADIYHVVPLGGDPTAQQPADMNPQTNPVGVQDYLNKVPGYPYVLVAIPRAGLKAALEGTIATGLFVNGDFFPGVSGLEVEYGLTTSATAPVQVKKMAIPNGPVLYDAANGGFNGGETTPVLVATTFYIGGVALGLGLPVFDVGGAAITSTTGLAAAVVRRGDGSSIKDFEALAQYIAARSAGNTANPGFLPAEYNGTVPRRVVCTGPGCPPGY